MDVGEMIAVMFNLRDNKRKEKASVQLPLYPILFLPND